MKFASMKKATLQKIITKCHLQIDPNQHVTALRHLVAAAIPTYIEDHFLRLVKRDLLPAINGPLQANFLGATLLKPPARNQTHLPESRLEFDWSWKSRKVSIEIHGGLKHRGSGHRTEAGVKRDIRKANLAQLHGWLHLQFTTEDIMDAHLWSSSTLPMIKKALCRHVQS